MSTPPSIKNFWLDQAGDQAEEQEAKPAPKQVEIRVPGSVSRDPALRNPPYRPDLFPRWGGCIDCNRPTFLVDEADMYCPQCRERRNLPPNSIPILPPWYERMTPEELEAVLTAPWTATVMVMGPDGEMHQRVTTAKEREKLRRTLRGLPAEEEGEVTLPGHDDTDYKKPTAFKLRYRRTDGMGTIDLMVGKLIPHNNYGMVFLHAASRADGEGQEHQITDCPCPVDDALVEKLVALGITHFYSYDRDKEALYRANIGDLMTAPAAVYAKQTIRSRRFLPSSMWQTLTGVREALLPDGRTRNLLRGDRLIMAVPWANQEVTIDPSPVAF